MFVKAKSSIETTIVPKEKIGNESGLVVAGILGVILITLVGIRLLLMRRKGLR